MEAPRPGYSDHSRTPSKSTAYVGPARARQDSAELGRSRGARGV